MSDIQLESRVAVVTGASRGIGQAIATALASQGLNVMMSGRSADLLSSVAQQIATTLRSEKQSGRIETHTADVRDPVQMEDLMAKTVDTFGRLDILINNAGVGHFQELVELSVEDWNKVIETNLSGVFFACRAAIPLLKVSRGGWIINISSLAGSHPFTGGAAYCASKAGLDSVSQVLMQELRYDNIRVSCVAPGSVDTRFSGNNQISSVTRKLDPRDVAQVIVDLLGHEPRSLPSRVEIRPSQPRK